MHLSAMLDSAVRAAGRKEALVCRDRRWSYGEFVGGVRRAATVLPEAGLEPGDRLPVTTYNTPHKIPREPVLRPELPRTPSGKVAKHVLRSGPTG
ncbi:hypothetical protein [Streptomyces sp. NPDC005780]|uniref:hypothetical protein n=1 Tax=Streptomyces sp. NPDC005780 TaxID=3364730 RepID=UPI003679CC0D